MSKGIDTSGYPIRTVPSTCARCGGATDTAGQCGCGVSWVTTTACTDCPALRAQVEELERTTHLLSVCLEPTYKAERDQARRDRDGLDHEKAQLKAEVEELTRELANERNRRASVEENIERIAKDNESKREWRIHAERAEAKLAAVVAIFLAYLNWASIPEL